MCAIVRLKVVITLYNSQLKKRYREARAPPPWSLLMPRRQCSSLEDLKLIVKIIGQIFRTPSVLLTISD